jgi:hypothetical protein
MATRELKVTGDENLTVKRGGEAVQRPTLQPTAPRARRRDLGVALALASVVALCGCGGNGPMPLESLMDCGGDWQTPFPTVRDAPKIAYADGRLYFDSAWDGISSDPVSGSGSIQVAAFPPSSFGQAFGAAAMWIEGDRVVYTAGDQENQFYSVPSGGGDAQLLLDAGAQRPDAGNAQFHALTSSDFVWTESSGLVESAVTVTTLWRASRADQAPVQIGNVTGLVVGMGVAGDAAIVAVDGGKNYAFALADGSGRALATNAALTEGAAQFVGLDGGGVFWSIPRPGAAEADNLSSVLYVPADGGPVRTFWSGSPTHSSVTRITADGGGGWIASVDQLFVEGFADSMWAIDAHGQGRRLACSPLNAFVIDDAPAIAPDAVFVPVLRDSTTEEVDRIPR